MAQRPSFGTLKKAKPPTEPALAPAASPAAAEPKPIPRIQTSIRLHPAMWAALNDLATRRTIDTGQRVTLHDLLIDGARHMLAVHGVKVPE